MIGAFPRKQPVKKAGADAPAFSTVKEASQSLRSQAQRKWKSFSPAACTSEKIPLGSQTCALCAVSAQCVRCREPQPFQTKAQRSGFRLRACQKHFFDKPRSAGGTSSGAPGILRHFSRASARPAASSRRGAFCGGIPARSGRDPSPRGTGKEARPRRFS